MTREHLLSRLENEGDWESCAVVSREDSPDEHVYSVWLNDDDNRPEPTTVDGMLRRLRMTEWRELLSSAEELGLARLVVDDRALIVSVYL